MLRLIRYLPVIIPVVAKVLRNPKVREILHLGPLPPEGRRRRR